MDERELFADEQAYIAWKRQQEAEAKTEARRAAQARAKRRKVTYSDRIRKALQQVKQHKYMARLRADPHRYEARLRYLRNWEARRRQDPVRYARQLEAQRKHYVNHREEVRLRVAAYQRDPEVKARRAATAHARYVAKKAAAQNEGK